MTIALRTQRLLLREWRDGDYEPFAAMCGDPELMRYYYQPPVGGAACGAWIDRMRRHHAEHGFACWAVEIPDEAGLIGAIGLTCVRSPGFRFAPAVESGWRLARSH